MNAVIYTFTGTGNSLYAARELAALLDAQVKYIPAELKAKRFACTEDIVGFVYPVYCWCAPGIVETFVKNIEFQGSPYIFAVANYGGSCGYALGHIEKVLAEKGLKLAAGCTIKMPSNYLPLPGVKPAEKCEKIFSQNEVSIKEIAAQVSGRHTGPVPRGLLLPTLALAFLRRFVVNNTGSWDTAFHLNGNCNSCGICVKVCPADNIEFYSGRPRWLHKCTGCLACVNYCPQKAIMMNGFSKNARYHHPAVTPDDLNAQKTA